MGHVMKGKRISAGDTTLKDVNGFKVSAQKDGMTIGGAKMVRPDGNYKNGVLHVIDQVLFPPD